MKILALCILFLVSCSRQSETPEAVLQEFVETQSSEIKTIKSESFRLISKSCQDNKCSLTYSVGYKTLLKEKTAFVTEVQKKAEMLQVKNRWLIAEVSNINTAHESLEPINL